MAQSAPTSPNVDGYVFMEELYRGGKTLVYRAVPVEDDAPNSSELRAGESSPASVIIKLLHSHYPQLGDLVRFRNQYVIAKNLEHPGIVCPLRLEPWQHSYALVMADFGGIALDEFLKTDVLDWPQVLNIALQMADILQYLSQQRVIHKDIKPANILIHPETKQIQLIDFSLASLLPKECQELESPGHLEGTLAYLAPEQTGRMNRGIDYRTDFYGLGVTLYELVTGKLPFESKDAMELLHYHLAKVPTAPHAVNNQMPQQLSAILLKLMAKNAEDRYQSALGLKHDLQECLSQWKDLGRIGAFELGQRDMSDRFLLSEKLYGREAEVQTLLAAFDRVCQGASELMLVAGLSGIGKTAVVNEVHKPITQKKGYFIKGKFDQLDRNIPLSAFVQAFRSLIKQLLSESDVMLTAWKRKILAAIGESGQVLIEVIPELEGIIGAQPAIPKLDGGAAQNRFNLLFRKFVRLFTAPAHPLVIFLDDLQWVDFASLNLLKLLMEDDSGCLLILGAYRDNEVSSVHSLVLALDKIRQQGTTLNTLNLKPLREENINHFVADSLNCPIQDALPFSQLVHQKTQGNPFFATQFLQGMYESGWINFDRKANHWQCNLTQIRQSALTHDVVAFMLARLQELPQKTQNILKIAACLGNQFDLVTLAVVCGQTQEDIAADLWSALQEGFVVPNNAVYKFIQGEAAQQPISSEINANYRFLHDRVQQAAYALIPMDQKAIAHSNIGDLLLQTTPKEQLEARIFEITPHLNRGIKFIASQDRKIQLCELNLLATKKAKACTAYIAAWQYVETGMQLLEPTCWQTNYCLTLDLYTEAVEISYLKGDLERMGEMAEIVLSHAQSILDRVKVHEIQLQSLSAQSQYTEAIEVGLRCLNLFGIHIPQQPTTEAVMTLLEKTTAALEHSSDQALIDLPEIKNQEIEAAIKILVRLGPSAYFVNPNLMLTMICQAFSLSLDYGAGLDTPLIFVNYGLVLCSPNIGEFSEGCRIGRIGEKMLQKAHNSPRKAFVFNNFYLFISHWFQHCHHSIKAFETGYQSALEVGDLELAGYNLNNQVICKYFVGKELSRLLHECQKCREICSLIKVEGAILATTCIFQTIYNLTHHTTRPWSFQGDFCHEIETIQFFRETQNSIGIIIFQCSKLYLNYLFNGDLDIAAILSEVEGCLDAMGGSLLLPPFAFIGALSYLSLAKAASGESNHKFLERAEGWINRFELWASHAPMNYQHKFDLIQAEKYRVLGAKLEALELYDKAIDGAKQNGYIQDEALANELAAQFYLDWGKQNYAALHMQESYYCYVRWGAKAKTNNLEQKYPKLLQSVLLNPEQSFHPLTTLNDVAPLKLSPYSSSSNSQSSTGGISEKLDLAIVLQASQAFAESIDLDELLQKMAGLMLQVSGADQLALLLPQADNSWQVRVSATPDNTQLTKVPLVNHGSLPVQLIQYVQRMKEVLVVDDCEGDLPFVDSFLQKSQPRSVICLPIVFQEKLNGLLYLQNQSAAGVFTDDRITVINFLCAQAGISLENAYLYKLEQNKTKQLSASEDRLKTLFNQAADAVFLWKGKEFIDCNQATLDLFHYPSKGDLLALKPHQISPERQPDGQLSEVKFQYMLQEALQRYNFRFEWVHKRFNGEHFWTEITLTPIKYQDETIFHCIARDISDRKFTEAALQLSEARAIAAFDQAAVGIFEINSETAQFTRCNDSFCQMLGYTEAELLQRTAADVTHPDYIADVYHRLGQLRAGELEHCTIEKRLLRKDGAACWVSSTISQMHLPGEAGERSLVVVLDISDRKQLEKEQDRLIQILQSTSDFVGVCQPGKGILWQNQPLRELRPDLNITEKEIPISHLYPEWAFEIVQQEGLPTAIQNGIWSGETALLTPSGEEIPTSQVIIAHKSDAGEIEYFSTILRDISDRKHYEQQLQELSKRLELAIESAQLGIWEWNRADNRLSWDERMFEIYGVQPENFGGTYQDWVNCAHPEDLERAEAEKRHSDDNNETEYQQEFRIVRPDGHVRYILATASIQRDAQGKPLRSVGTNVDITDRKAAELALQASERRYASLAAAAPVAIFRMDAPMNCIYVNDRWSEMTGRPAESALGKGWLDALHPDEREKAIAMWTDVYSHQHPRSFVLPGTEGRHLRPDGTVNWFYVQIAQEVDEQGNIVGYIGTLTDITERKEVELTLQETQGQFLHMTENVPGMIYRYVLHPNGSDELTYVSSQIRELFELEPEAALQNVALIWDRFQFDDISKLQFSLQKSAVTLAPHDDEFRLLLPQKGLRWVQIICRPERLENGDIAWDGIAIDISDRKATELSLQQSEEKFRTLVSNLDGAVYRSQNDQDWTINYMSDAVVDLSGYPASDFIENAVRTYASIIHPEDASYVDEVIAQAVAKQDSFVLEYRILHRDGSIRWVYEKGKGIFGQSNQPKFLEGVLFDISDRKHYEQEILESKVFLQTVLDTFPLSIFWKNRESRYIGVNQNFAQDAGFERAEDIVDLTDFDMPWSDTEAANYRADDLEVMQSDSPKIGIVETQVQADGTQVWVETNKLPLHDLEGTVIGVMGTYQDISDRKQAEAKLQRTNEELIRATRLKDEFLANMSHELRTPLNSVLGFSQLMQRDGSLSDRHKETLQTINRSGELLLSLINDILEMSKIEAGQTTLSVEPVDLPRLLEELKDMLKIKADAKHLSFDFSYASDLPRYIQVDDVKLKQILLNLLSNALKFTEQGQVSFYAEVRPPKVAEPDEKVHLRFSVEDTGPGISIENQETIFQPFVQAPAGKQSHQGTGLGLPISQKFSKMMGGDISVDSLEGKGSRFYCDIWVDLLSSERISEAISPKHYQNIRGLKDPQACYRLLIADDNPDNCALLSQILAIKGFELEIVSNGEEAVACNERWQPHLIWMDLRMPVMDGLEAVRQIRQSSYQPKIIAITAHAFLDERETALDIGCDDFISKPFSVNEVFERLERWLKIEFALDLEAEATSILSARRLASIGSASELSQRQTEIIQTAYRAMPSQWQERFQKSVSSLSDTGIQSLLSEIPKEQQDMIDVVSELIQNYRYDLLIEALDLMR